ncbi:MAG: molybdopterin oxidoreductase [Spirochaetae bacterium HGW-Spirochaetae-3]|jgi:CxxC motif-containing protein|nr:MAG: molybdopterin oxidoreductase [Spirochaetae bacterium HGW-Spirochaetae-3]
MIELKEFTCIECPRGCRLAVRIDSGVATVSGNSCPKGVAWGAQEAVAPMRGLTTTVRIEGSSRRRLPVRASGDMPLSRLLDAMAAIDPVVVRPPVRRGDVVLADLLGLGVDLVATDDLEADAERGAE